MVNKFRLEKSRGVELFRVTLSDGSHVYEVVVLGIIIFYPETFSRAYELFDTVRLLDKKEI